jgi:hypothetical protein
MQASPSLPHIGSLLKKKKTMMKLLTIDSKQVEEKTDDSKSSLTMRGSLTRSKLGVNKKL